MKLYFAGRFSRLQELLANKHAIETKAPEYGAEIEITSRWLLGGHEWVGTPDEEIPVERNASFASDDLEDLLEADAVVCFTESPRSGPARGGRHVEMGYALAIGKRILTVGHRENVFYCLPDIEFFPSWDDAMRRLLLDASSSPALVQRIFELEAELDSYAETVQSMTTQIAVAHERIDELAEQAAIAEVTAAAVEKHEVLEQSPEEPEPEPAELVPDPVERIPADNTPAMFKVEIIDERDAPKQPEAKPRRDIGEWTPERLKDLLRNNNISQTELARTLGVSSQLVSLWARGEYYPGQKYWSKLTDLEAGLIGAVK